MKFSHLLALSLALALLDPSPARAGSKKKPFMVLNPAGTHVTANAFGSTPGWAYSTESSAEMAMSNASGALERYLKRLQKYGKLAPDVPTIRTRFQTKTGKMTVDEPKKADGQTRWRHQAKAWYSFSASKIPEWLRKQLAGEEEEDEPTAEELAAAKAKAEAEEAARAEAEAAQAQARAQAARSRRRPSVPAASGPVLMDPTVLAQKMQNDPQQALQYLRSLISQLEARAGDDAFARQQIQMLKPMLRQLEAGLAR